MSIFEWINSQFFPLPPDLRWSDPRAVHAATAGLSDGVYFLLIVSWAAGAYIGGAVARYLSEEYVRGIAFALAAVLIFFGALNIILLGQSEIFTAIGLPLLAICTYVGHRYPWQIPGPRILARRGAL